MKLELCHHIECDRKVCAISASPGTASQHHVFSVGFDDGTVSFHRLLDGHGSEVISGGSIHGGNADLLQSASSSSPVTCLCSASITKVGVTDVVVATADGSIAVFSDGLLLSKHRLNSGATSACVTTGANDEVLVVVGDSSGEVLAFHAYSEGWKARTVDYLNSRNGAEIKALCGYHGSAHGYVAVATGSGHVLFYADGEVAHSIKLPGVPTAMTSGWIGEGLGRLVVGVQSGEIYVVNEDLSGYDHYCTLETAATSIEIFPITQDTNAALLVGGMFNSLKLYHRKRLVLATDLEDWAVSVAVSGGSNPKDSLIAVASFDGRQVSFYRLKLGNDEDVGVQHYIEDDEEGDGKGWDDSD